MKRFLASSFLAILVSSGAFSCGAMESMESIVRRMRGEVEILRNEKCTKVNARGDREVVFRPWSEAWEMRKRTATEEERGECERTTEEAIQQNEHIKALVWHYTAGTNVDGAYQAYYGEGVSAHFIVDKDGGIRMNVNPDTDIAFHAGPSAWQGLSRLNYYSIGIENVNPGFRKTCEIIPGFSEPTQIPSDARWWYGFSEGQFLANMKLAQKLVAKYGIPEYNVVTHADVAVGRKSDIGPKWLYKRAATEFGVGFWPEDREISDRILRRLSHEDYIEFIEAIGYHQLSGSSEKDLVRAYQMHFVLDCISGELTKFTKIRILQHVIDLYMYVSPTTGGRDEYFRSKFDKWRGDNSEKAGLFDEYL